MLEKSSIVNNKQINILKNEVNKERVCKKLFNQSKIYSKKSNYIFFISIFYKWWKIIAKKEYIIPAMIIIITIITCSGADKIIIICNVNKLKNITK